MLYIGPIVRLILAATLHAKIIHKRLAGPYISSIGPATTMVGIAESTPEKKRPVATADI